MAAVWAFGFCVLTVWINKGLSLPVGGTNERPDNDLQRTAIKDMSPNDISMTKAFALLQSMESKLIQAVKGQLGTNEVKAEAAIQKLEDVQLTLNILIWRDQAANPTSVPSANLTYGDQAANPTSVPSANLTYGDQAANSTSVPSANLTYGDQAANPTSVPSANLTYGDQAANPTSVPTANQTYGDQAVNPTSVPMANQALGKQPAYVTSIPFVSLMPV